MYNTRLEGWFDLARLLIDSSFEIHVRGRRNSNRGLFNTSNTYARMYNDYRWTQLVREQRESERKEKNEESRNRRRSENQKTEGREEKRREDKREKESGNGEGCAAARERMDSASRDVLLTVMSLSSPKVPRRHCINLLLPTPPY
ncbi:hypothetical protein PUN28_017068 [Cardiocondyla obscurior]|uniref:Uncharacterized protein n=1 Tax=Cardiocondyla obscurior TaxID=286306 RepID=A0AAW2EM94_9HYME